MSYDSRKEWDTDINSVGGAKDMHFVSSPYSNQASANSSQGALTYGNLINEFEPPKVMITPLDDGYYIKNRMNMSEKAANVENVEYQNAKVAEKYTPAKFQRATMNKMMNTVKTNADGSKSNQRTVPSNIRSGMLNTIAKTEQKSSFGNNVEHYTEMPEFVDSNIHIQESFSAEEKSLFIIIIISIITFCIVGVSFNILVPRIDVRHINSMNSH